MEKTILRGYYKWLIQADEPGKDYPDYVKIKEVFEEMIENQ